MASTVTATPEGPDVPKYTKKAHVEAPKVELPEEFEQVPIDVKQLVSVKAQLQNAEKLAQETAQAGITLVKAIGVAARLGAEAQEAEEKTRVALREVLTTHNVTVNEFRGFDFDKGVIKIQRGTTDDTGSTRKGA